MTAPATGYALLCVWPIVDETYSRDQLIEQALAELDVVAAEAGARPAGPSTWRVITDAAEIEGWEHWPGSLLVATMPAEPVVPAWRLRREAAA